MTKLGVFFGGISPEHEVSIITGIQLIKAVNTQKYEVIPVYIDKKGHWWSGKNLLDIATYRDQDLNSPQGFTPFNLSLQPGNNQIEVAILCFHGQYGEGGNVQGALELAQIPYQGPGVTSSAVCFDKIMLRQILSAENIQQPDYRWFTAEKWTADSQQVLKSVNELKYPLFVKPANGGSTIGIQRVTDPQNLSKTIEEVLNFDSRILVEAEVSNCLEINVSVLGTPGNNRSSVPEQPISKDELLSFADKYQRGGGKKSGMASASRRIPAPISASATQKVQDLAQKVADLFDCSGVIRIDFFVNPETEEIYVIEPNTIPGSMSYYLWEASDLPYTDLIDELVEIAQRRFSQRQNLTTTFESDIIKNFNH